MVRLCLAKIRTKSWPNRLKYQRNIPAKNVPLDIHYFLISSFWEYGGLCMGKFYFHRLIFLWLPKPKGFTLSMDCSVGYRLVANQDFFFFLPGSHVSRVPRVSLFSMPVPCIPTQPYSRCCPPHPSNCACDVFVFFAIVFFHWLLTPQSKKKAYLWLQTVLWINTWTFLFSFKYETLFLQEGSSWFESIFLGKCLLFTFLCKCIFQINLLKAMVTLKSLFLNR